MTNNLDELSTAELGQLFPIILSAPRTEWKDLFTKEKKKIITLLGDKLALRVEHFGSTAVPHLIAKPTIDILVEIPEGEHIKNKIIEIMTSNGYSHVPGPKHLMIVKGYTPGGFKGQCHHIHMVPKKDDGFWDRLYFRDYLIANPSVASEYAELKKDLAAKYKHDRDEYTKAKTEFIKKVTRDAKNALK